MSENKRIFLSGAIIAGLLLLIPPYLNFIGVSFDSNIIEENNAGSQLDVDSKELKKRLENKQKNEALLLNSSQTLQNDRDANELIYFNIQTDKLNLSLSNESGGSIKELVLVSSVEDGHKYMGGYDSNDIYQDSLNVSLVLNETKCSPCLSYLGGEKEVFIDVPFSVLSPKIKNNEKFVLTGGDSLVVNMSAVVNDVIVYKQTTYFGDKYLIKHSYEVVPPSSFDYNKFNLSWYGGIRNTEKDRVFEVSQYTQAYLAQNKNIEDFYISPDINDSYSSVSFEGKTDWSAIRNKYFINAFVSSVADGGFLGGESASTESGFVTPEYSMGLSFSGKKHFDVVQFLGPLDVDHIDSANTYLDYVMNFGWLPIQPFSRAVLWLLKFLHGFGLNYGVVLILFALLIRFITGPLTKKSFESSQNMQKIQPKIKKIQAKFKNDTQRMNREIMELYKNSGVNPLGGCLPMLIQMPLLFSLFIVFRSTIEFRGAPFVFWINNLSQPDTIFYLPFSIPIYGNQFAVLPVFLGLSMFLSQKLSMETMDSKQKPMMYMMSVFFFLLFNSFPSGLNLYYMVYNLLNYQQQRSMREGSSSAGGFLSSLGIK